LVLAQSNPPNTTKPPPGETGRGFCCVACRPVRLAVHKSLNKFLHPTTYPLQYLNRIKSYRYIYPIIKVDNKETNINAAKEDVAAAIALERQLELGLEGHRWFDLVRTGQFQTVMNEYYGRSDKSLLAYLPTYIVSNVIWCFLYQLRIC
jgi:hypothetical protein